MSIAIIYGSNGGVTEEVAEKIKEKLSLEADLIDIADGGIEVFDKYDKMILGTSTWNDGDLQDDWDDIYDDFKELSFDGKTIALFGVGDQEGFGDYFLDGMGTLYDAVSKNGATVIGGEWSTDSYDFEESEAVRDGSFVGLAIDEDNQDELTDERIEKWLKIIEPALS
ncbi:MAG: flavodoxin [Sulfurovum sp.]|nr:flavodoxin [Sulfurovum sp.]